jgi:heat shock protein HslJ
MKKLLISSLVLLLLVACSPATNESDLVSTNWRLQSLDGNEQIGEAIGGQPITLTFTSASEAGGSGGCNSFGADYSANTDTGAISFTNLISTLMACQAEGVTELEAQYFEALGAASTYQLSAGSLTLSGGGHTLVFVQG